MCESHQGLSQFWAFSSFSSGYFGLCGNWVGARNKIISGIDKGRLARPGIGNGWLRIDTCPNRTRVYLNLGLFLRFFQGILGFSESEGGRDKRELVESIKLVWLDLESAMVDFESTHVRIAPGFISILGFFFVFFRVFWASARVRVGEINENWWNR